MAITCLSTITVIDILNKIVRISADISVDSGPVHTIIMENADISTGPKEAEASGIIWNKFLFKYAEQLAQESIAQELLDLKTQLNANIEGRSLP